MIAKEEVAMLAKVTALYIVQHGWCQHKPRERDGSVCLRGAMDVTCVKVHPQLGPMVRGYAELSNAIRKATGMHVIQYNDTPGRTKEEVLAMLNGIAFISAP